MKKILKSLLIIGFVSIVAIAASQAYFSDIEKSTGNIFQAGAIDLKIDNTSYYNGQAWPETSWDLRDLTIERFFNFTDIKPGDWGEDTVSIHVADNPAYACVNIQITDNSDNGITDQEALFDQDTEVGELADELYFKFWIDDGDNVFEAGEDPIYEGPASEFLNGITFTLSDFGGGIITPFLESGMTYYIGKAWCYGAMSYTPASQGTNSPLTYDGFTCDGSSVGNVSQTDRLMGDITFYAEQQRNNSLFSCDRDLWDSPVINYINLENKDESWQVIEDDTYGTIAYSSGASNFYGIVQAQGLEANAKYQITLNGTGYCTGTDDLLASAGGTLFESGYWTGSGFNLSASCSGNGEGVYNMNLIDDHYTVMSDEVGNFIYPFNINLPTGNYTSVKVLVKKMLDDHVSPWVDSIVEHTTNLFETFAIDFTVN